VNSGSCSDGGGGRRCSSRAATGRRWRSENDGPMGKGGGGMDEMRGVGGGCKSRERRGGDVDGEPRAWHPWEELARGEGRRAIAILAVIMATARAAARTRSLRILPMCGGKRQERIEKMPTRGEDGPL
jgi:hypothetical protein